MIKALFLSRSYKKGIALSTLLVLLSKAIGFLNIVVIAGIFGTTASTDIFFFCTGIIATFSAFLTSLNSSIFIPEAMRIKEQRSEKESQEFLSFFLFAYLGICLVLSAAAAVDPVRTFSMASKFKQEILGENEILLFCSIPLLGLITINVLLADIFSSYKLFGLSAAAALLNSTVSILAVIFFHARVHVLSAMVGVLAANALQLAVSVYLLKKQCNWSFGFRFVRLKQKLVADGVIAQMGNFFTMLASYIPMMLLSMFPPGVLSALSYGSKIPDFLTLIVIAQFGAVAGIKFNELYAQKKEREVAQTFMDASAFLQFILVPLSIFISLFSADIVTVLFGRGAFDKNSISQTGGFMCILITLLPLLAHNMLAARLFMAAQKIQKSVVFQIVMSCLNVCITAAFIKVAGPKGFPLGLLVFYLINTFAVNIIMKKNFAAIPYSKTIVYTGKCLLMNAPVAAVVYGAAAAWPSRPPWLVPVFFIFYMSLVLALNQTFKINRMVARYAGMYYGRAMSVMRG